MSWQRYHTVWLVMGFGWISLYLIRMGLAPVLDMIMSEFQISYAMAGSLFSAIFYSYGLMQLPSGFMGDRFGRKKILVIGTFLWFVLTLGTAAVQTLFMLILMRFLTGIVQGAHFGNERATVVAVTPPEKMGQGQAFSFMGICIGLFFSVYLAGLIAEHFGNWRYVFVFFSIPSLVTSLIIFKFIDEPPRLPADTQKIRAFSAYRDALSDWNLWLLYLLGFVLLFAYWIMVTWMPSIYGEIGVKTVASRSLLSGVLGLMGIPGMIVCGLLSDRMVTKGMGRKGFIALLVFVWALLMLAIGAAVATKASSTLVTVLFLGSALFVFGVWPPYYAFLGEMARGPTVGTIFGLANFIGFLSAWVAPSLTGWMKDTTGSFSSGLYLSGGLLLVGTILILGVRSRQQVSGLAPQAPVSA